jgi:anti-sigma factor RsiW
MRHPDDMQLNAYLDGELRDDASQSFQAHLRACQACQARWPSGSD